MLRIVEANADPLKSHQSLIAFCRGRTANSGCVGDFFEAIDPDTLASELQLLPGDVTRWLKGLLKDSPDTESDWIEVARRHALEQQRLSAELRAAKRKAYLGEHWFHNEHDGVWQVPGFQIGLPRYQVTALREALGLPTCTASWEDWHSRHCGELEAFHLDSWFLQSRPRWFFLLQSGCGYQKESPFESNPGRLEDSAVLMDRLYGTNMDVSTLRALRDFVMRHHPRTFLNFQSFIRKTIERRQITEQQLSSVRPFLNSRPQLFANIHCKVRLTHLELHGSVPTVKAMEMLRGFVDSTVASALAGMDSGDYRIRAMTEFLTIQDL